MLLRTLLITGLVLFFFSCSKDEKPLYNPSAQIDPYKSYDEGWEALKENKFFFANKKFAEAEIGFKSPDFSAKAAIMSSFSLYSISFYKESEENLLRYLKTYPADSYVVYAHYLLAIIYFEQIAEEKNDMKPLIDDKEKINFFLEKYPNSEYSIDLKLKRDLILNQFAAKELYIARHYIKVQKWVPAINRLKLIVTEYDKTIFIEEALHRLVEIHYHIGLREEAKKYASILGYNYNSSEWFKQSYKVLNKNYKATPINKSKKDKTLLEKIIKIIK